MRKLLQHIRIEALLFLVFAALIWFVMTVSATTIERQYTMSFTADASVVGSYWMQDSTLNTQVTVRSKGLSALFMRQFNGLEMPFSAKNSVRANKKGLFMLPDDIDRILVERFGGDYDFSFSAKSDTFYFSTAALVTKSLPINFEAQSVKLPEGYRWISVPTISPSEIEITGPIWAIPNGSIGLDVPQTEWKGRKRENLSLQEFGSRLTQSANKTVITAHSDLWVEDRFTTKVEWDGRKHDVKLWLSGPFTLLKPGEWEQYVNVALHAVEDGVGLDVDSKNSLVTVLSYSPKILVHSQQ
jgi:hypothetical protein